jgi:hypothetical protein
MIWSPHAGGYEEFYLPGYNKKKLHCLSPRANYTSHFASFGYDIRLNSGSQTVSDLKICQ